MKPQKTVCHLLTSVQIGLEHYPLKRDAAIIAFISRSYLVQADIEQAKQEFSEWQQSARSQGFRLANTGLLLTDDIITGLNNDAITFNVSRDIVINAYFIKLLLRLKNDVPFLAL